ncbi:unnamed protein product [Arctogadus glacialis]
MLGPGIRCVMTAQMQSSLHPQGGLQGPGPDCFLSYCFCYRVTHLQQDDASNPPLGDQHINTYWDKEKRQKILIPAHWTLLECSHEDPEYYLNHVKSKHLKEK